MVRCACPRLTSKGIGNFVKQRVTVSDDYLRVEQHISRSMPAAAAIGGVKVPIGAANVVAGGVTESAGGAIDGVGAAFEFEERADGGLVEVESEARRRRRKVVRNFS